MAFRGASADAYHALADDLRDALGGDADAARVGDDLFTVSQLLRSEPGLRRVATDVSIDASAKKRLVGDLFGGKVDDASLELVRSAVGRRWTVTRDLADALENLSETATVRSAGGDAGRLADELFGLAQVVTGNPELRDALSDPARSRADKAGLVKGLLEGKALPATITLAVQSLAGTYRTVTAALTAYQHVAAEVHGERIATVRVAHELPESEQERLRQALAQSYDRDVHLNVVVDPQVIGGMRVEIGDDVIDGTVAARLDTARRQLAG